MRRIAAAAALVLAAVVHQPPALAAVEAVAGPGSWLATYATPVVVAAPGVPLSFVNADVPEHDLVSEETRAPGSAPWCPAGGPRCPLFFASLIGTGGVTPVEGLADVPRGIYPFYCNPHPWMEGTLVVA